MGLVQSNLAKKPTTDTRITVKKEVKKEANMSDKPYKFNISNPLNSSYRVVTNKTAKPKTVKREPHQRYDPQRDDNGTAASSSQKLRDEYISTFRWTPSSDFDNDLVSSFDRLEPLKSISYERLMASQAISFERLRPLTRIGSGLAESLRRSFSGALAECQGLDAAQQKVSNPSTYVPTPSKDDQMNLDAASSRTTSTDMSEGSTSTRQVMHRYDLKSKPAPYLTTNTYGSTNGHVSTATTNVTYVSDENAVKRPTASPNQLPKLLGQNYSHVVDRRKPEPHDHSTAAKREAEHMAGHHHKSTCMPSCFGNAAKTEGDSDKPSYNSMCTKCMHKEDKIPKGFKGMILQLPSHKSETAHDKSPYLDRSNIVLQTPLLDGKQIEDVYDLTQDKLGKGSYGNVLKGVHKQSGAVRAVKIIRKAKIENAMRMKREIQIMKKLDHPSIIKLFEVYEDLEYLYLVMEMCTGGELFDRIVNKGSFSENYAAFIMRQVFSAIAYCHSRNVLHRDLKPENILYSNNTNSSPIKIIDWGFATKCFRSHKFTSLVGTPYYVAPEVLLGNYDKACDIWSAGVILFILLVGYPPFHGSNNAEILKNVKRGCIKFIPKHWTHVSKSAMDLITRCLSYIPKNRITAEDALNHEWILKCTTLPPTVAPNVSKSLARRFRNFLKFNKMKQMALTCIAYHLSEKELAPLTSAFEALDRDGDGMLSLSEVAKGLQPSKQSDSNIEKIVRGLDTDQSGAIEYTEFIAASIDTRLYDQKDFCARAFNIFDTDGDGKITREDMFRVFAGESTSVSLTHEMVNDILKEVDLDRDGTISYNEFYSMLYGWPEATKI